MAAYTSTVLWERRGAPFVDLRYSRAHRWHFDGGLDLPASASAAHVPAGTADPSGVDPEEAFVAALSSCHMLFFLSLAARRGLVVERYRDDAEGRMTVDQRGRQSMTQVVLRPCVRYAPGPDGALPDAETQAALHHEAHELCYLANSVRTEMRIEPVDDERSATR
jgi:organic hydroperoxide reductase OsmC/OhrA